MAKKEKYLKDFLGKIDSGKNVNLLYKDNALNHQRYYEDYSTILLEHNILEYLNKINPNEIREESYMVKEHNGITEQGDIRKPKFQWEERECIALKNYYTSKKTEDNIKILDYQMPLKILIRIKKMELI